VAARCFPPEPPDHEPVAIHAKGQPRHACKTTVQPVSASISPGWHIVDIAFTSSGLQVYYDGSLYVTINENVTTGGNDPMWLTFSEGSCAGNNGNVCAAGAAGVSGNVQVKYLRIFG
jgi:hypothetical protein